MYVGCSWFTGNVQDAVFNPYPMSQGGHSVKRLGTLCSAASLLMLGIGMMFAPRAARAQDNSGELSKDWAIRVGTYIYQSQTTRNQNGDVGFSGTVERTVYRGNIYDVNVGIGYNGWDSVYSVPVMVTAILHKANFRYGAGVGYAFNKRLDGLASNGTALSLLAGYQFGRGNKPLSIDARYYFIGGSSNELDGLSLIIGGTF